MRKSSMASEGLGSERLSTRGSQAGSKNQKEEDFDQFLESMDDYLFDKQTEVTKNTQNINKVREKAL